jgi:hypothetical protein
VELLKNLSDDATVHEKGWSLLARKKTWEKPAGLGISSDLPPEMKTINTEVLDLIRTKQPTTFEQLLEDADLQVYNRLLRPGIMATILTELLAAQAI